MFLNRENKPAARSFYAPLTRFLTVLPFILVGMGKAHATDHKACTSGKMYIVGHVAHGDYSTSRIQNMTVGEEVFVNPSPTKGRSDKDTKTLFAYVRNDLPGTNSSRTPEAVSKLLETEIMVAESMGYPVTMIDSRSICVYGSDTYFDEVEISQN